MIVSMTGFGDANTERSGTHYSVEIRSLNNRFFKPVIKLPENVSGLEPELESMLREKLGRTLDFTHSVVPDLNRQLAPRIHKALAQLAPGAAWERENWGLSRDAERNHFTGRPRRRLDASVTPEEVWLRIERQVLVKLPSTGGILFGIRLEIVPWLEVVADPEAPDGLKRALASMPDEVAHYKGIHQAQEVMLRWLG